MIPSRILPTLPWPAPTLTTNTSPPDMKHHRIPAPGMSFTQPNLPALIQGIEELLKD
jgi:hypothetical protein